MMQTREDLEQENKKLRERIKYIREEFERVFRDYEPHCVHDSDGAYKNKKNKAVGKRGYAPTIPYDQ